MTANSPPRLLDVRDDVRRALEQHAPVVALESTIITHGMPHPHNCLFGTFTHEHLRALRRRIPLRDGRCATRAQADRSTGRNAVLVHLRAARAAGAARRR